ncbi:olfactory receptor 8C8-like [Genypterus blacodes]|uniref:olfactory receptor 8C8-like n=1 Tax=Genypterus blacodes TaxID=154954 RepID=UPI003F767A72
MMVNASVVTVFTLSGLNYSLEIRISLFFLSLLWYLMILTGNAALIIAIVMDKNLHNPMYIFLCNLCINGLYGAFGFYPKFLLDLLSSHVITPAGCMLQGFVLHASLCSDYTILALMAMDRYVAICQPLYYHSFMTKKRVTILVFLSWLIPHYSMLMNSGSLLGSELCGSHIDRLYCVNFMILKLTCVAPKSYGAIAYVNIGFYILLFVCILFSYVSLVKSISSSQANWAMFTQTCLPHFISLLTFAASALLDLLYMRFGSQHLPNELNNFVSMEYLLFPPLINPLVYGIQLTKIRKRILHFVHINWKKAKVEVSTLHIHDEHST